MSIHHVAVIGAGTMGNGIAHVLALAGHDVTLVDVNQERLNAGLATIEKNLGRQVSKEKITEAEQVETLARIACATDLSADTAEADLVIEAATENPKTKAEIFRALDRATKPGAILASNTSSISITQIAAETERPAQVIGMHFFNPVPVMKLVEIVRGLEPQTRRFGRSTTSRKSSARRPSRSMTTPASSRTGS